MALRISYSSMDRSRSSKYAGWRLASRTGRSQPPYLKLPGTVLQVDVEFVEIRRAAVDDDEPRIIFRLRIEAGEAQGRDVPIEVVAAKTLDDPVCLVAEPLRGKPGDVARIEGAAVGPPCQRGDRSSAVRQIEAHAESAQIGLR